MSYYKKCSLCGANLDPGERCDCQTNPDISLYRIKVADMRDFERRAYLINKALGFYDGKDDINDQRG